MEEGLKEFVGHFDGYFRSGGEHAGVACERNEHLFGKGLIGFFRLEPVIGQLKFYGAEFAYGGWLRGKHLFGHLSEAFC
jgi:hypothetical protein